MGTSRLEIKVNGVQTDLRFHLRDNALQQALEQELSTESYSSENISFTLDHHVLKGFKLKEGTNTIEYSTKSAFMPPFSVSCNVYKWPIDAKIVISDIDGTITRSDAMGMVLPFFGVDWTQDGIAELYTEIAKLGFKFVYLSNRGIGMGEYTRRYVRGIKQGNFTLPDGPVILNPSPLWKALYDELITGHPELTKIRNLQYIVSAYKNSNPLAVGFGNHLSDHKAYQNFNIHDDHILIIDTEGIYNKGTKNEKSMQDMIQLVKTGSSTNDLERTDMVGLVKQFLASLFICIILFCKYFLLCIICVYGGLLYICLLYTSPSPRDGLLSRMPSSA
eukprot:TRINITY_DN4187_c0_g1_i11.p1 TRINITY_DN4187_c0_g1~~TRINITY_DN4187_c0_g1_i11.p1  ORF type:complete len:333 (+),score=37.52 TRINITY_DN4187_c0_g1_i11:332-1330(+)